MHLTANWGFIEHGHLYGEAALIVTCGTNTARTSVPDMAMPPARVHFLVDTPAEAAQASRIAASLVRAGVQRISASVRPGVTIPRPSLAYESVLVLDTLDFDLTTCETQVASVSVHTWMGSGVLDTVQRRFEAARGLFLVLPSDEVGDAKVWLSATRNPRWKILPSYPFNKAEDAELMEMLRT